ncbi:MAG: hypothetical protein LBI38_00360 [Oscillospiraceae bacterium]|jgi:hypothetical protein|nr:hypothetical protein [Oscillospiraceae bacterium]
MSFDINREIIYFKYSPQKSVSAASKEPEYEGLDLYAISRPEGIDEADFATLLNFFRRIDGEYKFDGARYANETLTSNNLHFFCLNSGAAMFKITESAGTPGNGQAELFGFFIALSDVRTAWLYIDKLCYMLAGEEPGKAQSGTIEEDMVSGLDANSVKELPPVFRSSLMELAGRLAVVNFPESFALTCLPESFFPDGVKVYENGFMPVKTDGSAKEKTIEFDDALLARLSGECKEPLKSAVIISVSNDDEENVAEVKKGGFFGKFKKNQQSQREVKAVNQWRYDFISNLQRQSENCDFIRLNAPVEYSPIMDTFKAYVGIVPGSKEDKLIPVSKIPSANIFIPGARRRPSVASMEAPPSVASMEAPPPVASMEAPPSVAPMEAPPSVAPMETPPSVAPKKEAKPSVTPMKAGRKPSAVSETVPPSHSPKAAVIDMVATGSSPSANTASPSHSPNALSLDMTPRGKSAWDSEPETRYGSLVVSGANELYGDDGEPTRPKFGRSQIDKSAVEDMMPHSIYMNSPKAAPVKPPVTPPPPPIFEVKPIVEEDESDDDDVAPAIEIAPFVQEPEPATASPPFVQEPEPATASPFVREPEAPPVLETVPAYPSEWEIKPMTNPSSLPPPPVPVTIAPSSVWNASSAETEEDGETSGEMEAVTLKPKSSGNSVMDLYYQNLKNKK